MNDMYTVRRDLLPIVNKNMAAMDAVDTYAEVVSGLQGAGGGDARMEFTDGFGADDIEGGYVPKASRVIGGSSPSDAIIDIREYDIPYYLRVAIDKGLLVDDIIGKTGDTDMYFPKKFGLDFGTLSLPRMARSVSTASKTVWSERNLSSWHSTLK